MTAGTSRPEPAAETEQETAVDSNTSDSNTADSKSADASTPTAARPLTALTHPAGGVPDVVVDERELMRAAEAIGAGTGPVAIDAERASGYRYGQRAYLVQLRREGSGSWLFDPAALPDLSPIGAAIGEAEWILHAATQDLPCLAEVGMRPRALFDTELGGRIAGLPRVGLGAMVEHYLGLSLAKEHSAVDWSTRPLPEPWLRYAVLDVEVLVELRDAVAADLAGQGKHQWAAEEFVHLLDFTGPEPRTDPWRRTSGTNKVRTRQGMAIVRELWRARDGVAQQRDTAPGRVFSDAVIADLATTHQRATTPPHSLSSTEPRLARSIRRHQELLRQGIADALQLPEDDLPTLTLPATGPPPARAWADRDPVAAARLARARELVTAVSAELAVPVENLLTPDLLRRYLWDGPDAPTTDDVTRGLLALGARRWQTTVTAPLVSLTCVEIPVA